MPSPLGKRIFAAALTLFAVCPISHRAPKKCWPTSQSYWLQLRQSSLGGARSRAPHSTYVNVLCLAVQLESTTTQQPSTFTFRLSIHTWLSLAQWDATLAPNPSKLQMVFFQKAPHSEAKVEQEKYKPQNKCSLKPIPCSLLSL